MNLIKDYSIEINKQKRRKNLLLFIGVVLAEMFFVFGNYSKQRGLEDGWMLMFYNMPIMNSLFLPVVVGGFASRLMDLEHKGDMLKCLYTFTTPARLFFTKYIYGALSILALVVMQCASMVLMMNMLDFPRNFGMMHMLFYGMATFVTCMTLFSIHMILSFFHKNQALGISVGILGSFLGLFSAYLPESVFQKLLPWGTFATSLFIRLDWDRETRETAWILEKFDFSSTLINIGWIAILIIVSLVMLNNTGVEESERREYAKHTGSVRIHRRPVELMKLKGSPAWYAFIIVPVLSAVIGTFNYLGNIEILTDGWYSLWTQHTLFTCYFFMPVIIGIFAGCIWRVEHAGTNMNILMTHETPLRIVLGKFGATCAITSLSILWIAALYLFAGKVVKMEGELPKGLIGWLIMGIVGAWAICAFQIFISLIIRNFIIPVIIAFLGGIAGLGCMAKGFYYLTPYSLFDLAMNQRDYSAEGFCFVFSTALCIALFLVLSIVYLRRHDVRTNE